MLFLERLLTPEGPVRDFHIEYLRLAIFRSLLFVNVCHGYIGSRNAVPLQFELTLSWYQNVLIQKAKRTTEESFEIPADFSLFKYQ